MVSSKVGKQGKKTSLRERLEGLSSEFSAVLAARVLEAKARKIMEGRSSYKFRLCQLVSLDARAGKIWEQVPVQEVR